MENEAHPFEVEMAEYGERQWQLGYASGLAGESEPEKKMSDFYRGWRQAMHDNAAVGA